MFVPWEKDKWFTQLHEWLAKTHAVHQIVGTTVACMACLGPLQQVSVCDQADVMHATASSCQFIVAQVLYTPLVTAELAEPKLGVVLCRNGKGVRQQAKLGISL